MRRKTAIVFVAFGVSDRVGTAAERRADARPVRLAYQPPASSTFLSEQISHQQPANSTFLSEQTSTSHQPPAKRTGWGSVKSSDRWAMPFVLVILEAA
jgi:hypothetical protein